MAMGFPQPDAAGKHFILICPVTVMPAIEQKSNANPMGGTLFHTRLESRIVPAIEGKKARFQLVVSVSAPAQVNPTIGRRLQSADGKGRAMPKAKKPALDNVRAPGTAATSVLYAQPADRTPAIIKTPAMLAMIKSKRVDAFGHLLRTTPCPATIGE
jgi:hypothetical protein